MTPNAESRPRQITATLRYLPRALRLVWDAHHGLALLLSATTLLQALLPAAGAWVGKLVVDGVVQATSNPAYPLSDLGLLVGLAFGVALAGQALSTLAEISQDLLRELLTQRINITIIEKATSLDLSYYETPAFYDMLQRAQQEASYRPLAMMQGTFSLMRSIITLASLVALLLRFSLWIVLVVAITSLPALWMQSVYGRARFQLYSERAPEWRKLNYLGLLLTAKHFAKEIKLFRLSPALLEWYKRLYSKFYRENRALSIKRNLAGAGLQLLALLGYYGSYFAVILQAIGARITLGDLTMYTAVLMQVQNIAGSLMLDLAGLYEQGLFLGNLFAFLELQPRIPPGGSGQPAPAALHSGIQMHNVTFRYPGAGQAALHHIDLTIAPGEKIALVGENGAGKTTLIKLLTRLYDPTEGTITFDGIPLREIDPASLHSRIGVIFQDFVQYYLSGRENIGFGQIEAMADEERIRAAAEKSGAHEVLSRLADGYDTILGRWFDDGGTDLSVGQWQKVALARAYMRDAPILILDEPTAALDAKAEYEVYKRFRDLSIERTVILISHRFSTVRIADRIIVLNNGHIVEQGTHEELLAAGGTYANMFNLQAEGYR